VSSLKVKELNVHDNIIKELQKSNIGEATSLQQTIIHNVLSGQSLIAKPDDEKEKIITIAITALDVASHRETDKGTICLILSSSPERVQAIHKQITELKSSDLSCISIDETGKESRQQKFLDEQPTILIATPERLQKVLRKQRHIFRDVHYVVLDGLDEMISANQRYYLKRIRLRIFSDYTTLIFASDLDENVKEISSSFTRKPVVIGFTGSVNGQMKAPAKLPASLKQGYINVPPRMKISTLMAYIQESSDGKCAIFTASKRGTDRLYKVLKRQNIQSVSLHGRLNEGKKAGRFERFTSGQVSYLLVSDISAAELELSDIDQVINYDVPDNTDEYRFRATLLRDNESAGIISLVSEQDRSDVLELQNELKVNLEEMTLPESVQKKAENRKRGSGSTKRQQDKKETGLPRPSYDKLSGGRNGDYDEKQNRLVKFFKKLFTS
jgi:superfamily II DNA/RNA helicase